LLAERHLLDAGRFRVVDRAASDKSACPSPLGGPGTPLANMNAPFRVIDYQFQAPGGGAAGGGGSDQAPGLT